MHTRTYIGRLRLYAQRIRTHDRAGVASGIAEGKEVQGSEAISETVETEVDKQTCRRPRGHRKHGGVADA